MGNGLQGLRKAAVLFRVRIPCGLWEPSVCPGQADFSPGLSYPSSELADLQGWVISSYGGSLPKIAASCPVRCWRQPVMQRFRKQLHHGEWV